MVLIPSFHPGKGKLMELSITAGRTMSESGAGPKAREELLAEALGVRRLYTLGQPCSTSPALIPGDAVASFTKRSCAPSRPPRRAPRPTRARRAIRGFAAACSRRKPGLTEGVVRTRLRLCRSSRPSATSPAGSPHAAVRWVVSVVPGKRRLARVRSPRCARSGSPPRSRCSCASRARRRGRGRARRRFCTPRRWPGGPRRAAG